MNGAQFTILLRAIGQGQVASEFGKVQAVVGKLNGLLAALGVTLSAGALTRAVKQAIDYADAMGKTAQKVGVAVDQLSRLSVAAKLNDLSMQQLAEGLKNMSRYLSENGQGGKSTEQALTDLADTFQRMPDGIQKTALAMKVFGRAGIEMIPLLNQGKSGIEGMMREAKQLGVVVGPQFYRNAETFNDNLSRIGFAFQGVFLQLADRLLPTLVKFTEWILDVLRKYPLLQVALEQMTSVFKTLAAVVTEVAFAFDALGSFIGTFAGAIAGGGNPFEAWSAAADQFDAKLRQLQQRMASIGAIGEPGEDATGGGVSTPTPGLSLEDQRRRLDFMIEGVRLSRQITEQNRNLSPVEKQRELNNALRQEIGYIKEKISLSEQAHFAETLDDAAFNSMNVKDRAELFRAQQGIGRTGVGQELRYQLQEMVITAGTYAQQIASTITSTIGSAFSSLSQGISGLIQGTMTWGNALRQIGGSIITSVIDGLVKMFQTWIVQRLLLSTVEKSAAAQEAAAKAPSALMTSITSYGVAALVGAAALAAVVAAMGGFESGGYTGDGPSGKPMGVVHPSEFVLSAPAVDRIGVPALEAMNAGQAAPAAGGGQPINIAFIREEHVSNWLRSTDGRQVLLNVMRQEMHRI